MTAPDPTLPEGFPDLFIYTLADALRTGVVNDPEFPADNVMTRPLRVGDPNRSISVVEGIAEPVAYEIGDNGPSGIRWTAVIQVLTKGVDPIDARNTRIRLMQRCRRTLHDPATVQSLLTLSDDSERVSRFRWTRMDFDSATAREAQKQFAYLGHIELTFDTEDRGNA